MKWLMNPVTAHAATAMPNQTPTRAVTAVLRSCEKLMSGSALTHGERYTPVSTDNDTLQAKFQIRPVIA